jgi:hypothetical protein
VSTDTLTGDGAGVEVKDVGRECWVHTLPSSGRWF